MKIIIFTVESEHSYLLLRDLINQRPKEIEGIFVSKMIKYKKILKFLDRKVIGGLGAMYYLERLIKSFHHNRTKKTVHDLAKKNNIPIYYISNINDFMYVTQIERSKPQVIISAYFDQIIKSGLLNIPIFGIINIHLSLLPKYRGVKPVFWVLKNNETKTGISLHLMDEGLDTGEILAQEEITIFRTDSVDSLTKRMSEEGARLLILTLNKIENGTYILEKQDNSKASYFSQPTKKDLIQFINLGKKFY